MLDDWLGFGNASFWAFANFGISKLSIYYLKNMKIVTWFWGFRIIIPAWNTCKKTRWNIKKHVPCIHVSLILNFLKVYYQTALHLLFFLPSITYSICFKHKKHMQVYYMFCYIGDLNTHTHLRTNWKRSTTKLQNN